MYNKICEPETTLITPEEMASLLNIGLNSAYTLLREGKVKAYKIGKVWKIPRFSIDEFILSQCKKL